MTRKLYYEDCHLARFTAHVVACEEAKDGWLVTLDATAFYPEGGGQACDTGTLNGMPVTDVREQGEEVVHLCAGALEVGAEVEGVIDYDRRFDLMQQHTGEHIVSGIVNRRYGYHNTGFHIGADVIQIDFDGVIPAADLASIEAEVNAALWADIPVRCWYPSPEELPQVFYRTKRALPWPVRIVEVPGYDACACCGVHVKRTGEVGIVKLFTVYGLRGGSRVELACGKRALAMLSAAYDQNRQVSQAFSVPVWETGEAARKMNEALAGEKFRSAELWKRLFRGMAEEYRGQANALCFQADLESVQVRELADEIAGGVSGMAAVFSGSDDVGYSYCLVSRDGDLRPFGKAMTQALSGRGGGKPGFQQGRVSATEQQIRDFFRDNL